MRKPDWPSLLDRFLEERAGCIFAWGRNDCGLFAADAVLAMTGRDPAARIRGGYRGRFGALRALRRISGPAPDAAGVWRQAAPRLAAAAGFAQLASLKHAQRGDLVLVESGHDGPAFGIVTLNPRWAASVGGRGMLMLPTHSAIAAWRV